MTTGKNKERFIPWIINYYEQEHGQCTKEEILLYWSERTNEERWGVFLLYYDSIGININVMQDIPKADGWIYDIDFQHGHIHSEMNNNYLTRSEAQTEALKKADLIANE